MAESLIRTNGTPSCMVLVEALKYIVRVSKARIGSLKHSTYPRGDVLTRAGTKLDVATSCEQYLVAKEVLRAMGKVMRDDVKGGDWKGAGKLY